MLSAIILFAFIVRYYYTNIGLPYLYYWDEPQTASTALRMMKTGDFNPHFFAYGTSMIYANLLVDILNYFSLMGHPSTDLSYLNHLNEIKINIDSGWKWTISHPSFYHANRILSVLIGTSIIFVTYLIGKILVNRWVGLISATFLALLPFFIIRSVWITSDMPVALFVLSVVLFSLLFIQTQKISYFLLATLFVGIAIATKYNAGISISIPILALLFVKFYKRKDVATYLWFISIILPILIFVMIMPYALIDLPTFLRHVGGEIRHYKVLGQGIDDTALSPIHHIKIQLQYFYNNIGLTNTIFIIMGTLGVIFRPLAIFTMILPILYFSYMMGTKVTYHRNFIQIYPFFALLFGFGFYNLYLLFNRLKLKASFLITIIALIIFIPQSIRVYQDAKIEKVSRDSRTHAMISINIQKGYDSIVIAKELRVHSQDLRLLKKPYKIVPLLDIAKSNLDKNILYVVPAKVSSNNYKLNKDKIVAMRDFINSISNFTTEVIKRNDSGDKRSYVGVTRLEYFSVNPTILLIKVK
jgi:4-amino-4-deoxy-L-arabinose transferase-like glycosyltransferase